MATKATKTEATSARKFAKDDLIPCRSITSGELLMVGKKSGLLYKWADYGDVQDVEYQDLAYDVRMSGVSSFSRYPRFVIADDDFVVQNPQLNETYKSVYTTSDLRKILSLPSNRIAKAISELPSGAKESLRSLASTAILNGTLDSVGTIKVLDSVFGTMMLQTLANK